MKGRAKITMPKVYLYGRYQFYTVTEILRTVQIYLILQHFYLHGLSNTNNCMDQAFKQRTCSKTNTGGVRL